MYAGNIVNVFHVDGGKMWNFVESSWILGLLIRVHIAILAFFFLSGIVLSVVIPREHKIVGTWFAIWIITVAVDCLRCCYVGRSNIKQRGWKLFANLLGSLIFGTLLVMIPYLDGVMGLDLDLQAAEVSLIVFSVALTLLESALIAHILYSSLLSKLR